MPSLVLDPIFVYDAELQKKIEDISINYMTNQTFIHWLTTKLKEDFHQSDVVIDRIYSIYNNKPKAKISLAGDRLDALCKKYYADFDLEKTEYMKIGYSDPERDEIRAFIKNISSDLVSMITFE
jgi:hypothetical protein